MSESTRTPSPARRAYRFVNRPYYWYRPTQLALRLRSRVLGVGGEHLARTAWGSRIRCWPDPLGLAIERTGVYDLVVVETLARLAEPRETAVDAGANVGFMSNVLTNAVGAAGRVICFEPHPLIWEMLISNVSRWRTVEGIENIDARQAALSSTNGTSALAVDPQTFSQNKGTASLEQAASGTSIEVATVRLDDQRIEEIGVLKLDVEGHELAALEGAHSLLSRRLIRDILFEEHRPPPTPVTELLESHGYCIFGVRQGFAGPILSSPGDAYRHQLWDPPALLATIEPQRARAKLKRRGWSCLRRSFNRYPGK